MSRIAALLFLCPLLLLPSCGGDESAPEVLINSRALGSDQLQDFETRYGARPQGGPWWYDPTSGLYGKAGGPAEGFLETGHDFGPLAVDASAGDTGVFINGRELPAHEYQGWALLFGQVIWPGRYWLDGSANYGIEGFPPSGNLLTLLAGRRRATVGAGGDRLWSTRFSAGNSTADNSAGYVSVPGVGPIGYGM